MQIVKILDVHTNVGILLLSETGRKAKIMEKEEIRESGLAEKTTEN